MKVVVAGGTGFVGTSLCSYLQRSGHDVVILSRSRDAKSNSKAEVKFWDPSNPGSWAQELSGAGGVINLAGANIANRWTEKYKRTIIASRLEAAAGISAAIQQIDQKPPVVINASAVGYYGNVESGDVTESRAKGTDFLADTCHMWEEAARKIQRPGIRLVIARTGIVLGKGGGALAKMIPPFRMFAGGPLGSGRQAFPWIHIEDVAGAMEFCLTNPAISGPVNFTAPNPSTMSEFCGALGKTLNRPSWAPVPAFALKLLLGEMSEMLLTGQRAVPEKLQRAGYQFKHRELEEALRDIFSLSHRERE